MARTVFHALTYNADVPPSKEESERKKPPGRVWDAVNKYRAFRDNHDAKWTEAQLHPIKLYEFFGLNTEGLAEVLGEPPEKKVKAASQADLKQEMAEREKRLRASLQAAAKREDSEG